MNTTDTDTNRTSKTSITRFYIAGGTLPTDAPSYIPRKADEELHEGLRQGDFCYVLVPRQMGKSSLMVHTAARLRAEGVTVAILDLTAVGQQLTAEQWYNGLLMGIGQQLDMEDELEDFWFDHENLSPIQRWMEAIRQVVLPRAKGSVVIFVDEIDTIRSLPFPTDEFFAAIRSCYNRRSQDAEFNRLTFCLLGVATPTDLIRNPRTTPFNIGRRIELTDFTEEDAAPLLKGLGSNGADPRKLLRRILHWTGGHPYLTQRLCSVVSENGVITSPSQVDQLCEELFLSQRGREQDTNLTFVRDRILRSPEVDALDIATVLTHYAKVRSGKAVEADDANPPISLLKIAGIVRAVEGELKVRNRIYEQVFDKAWIKENMPDAELRRQRAAFWKGVLRMAAVATSIVAVVSALAVTAVLQARRAERATKQALILASRLQADRGVRLLESGNAFGLLDLLEARKIANDIPNVVESRTLLWSGWYASHAGRLVHNFSHDRAVNALAFSPDGKLLATGSSDNTARLWDTATGKPHTAPLQHDGSIFSYRALAFSPDGKLLATGSFDRSVRLWDTETGRLHTRSLPYPEFITVVTFSPDGKLITAGSTNSSAVRLWETVSGQPHGQPLQHQGGIWDIAFSPDGKLIATASTDNTAKLWITATGQPYGNLLRHKGIVNSVTFSPDGKLIATSSTDNTAQIWVVATGQPHGNPLWHKGVVNSVAFSPDGKLLTTASGDDTAQLWEVDSGRPHSQPLIHQSGVRQVAFSPDGKLLATVPNDNTARLWDIATGQLYGEPLQHQGWVTAVDFSPDGKLVATASLDNTARLWKTQLRRPSSQSIQHSGSVVAMTFSSDGKLLATASQDDTVRFWETETGQLHGQPFRHPTQISAADFSHDSKLAATASPDNIIRLWETATGRAQGQPIPFDNGIAAMAFSPDGSLLATSETLYLGGGSRGIVKLWNLNSGKTRLQPLQQERSVLAIAFSPDGKLMAAGLWEGTVRLYEVSTGKTYGQPLKHSDNVQSVTFSPDGKLLASASDDRTVKVWELASGQLHIPPLAHENSPLTVAFRPDGRLLATGSQDGRVRLWETDSGQPYGQEFQHQAPVSRVAFSPDGKWLASGSSDGVVRIWLLPEMPTDLREMELRTWTTVGTWLSERGNAERISWQDWQRLKGEIQELESRQKIPKTKPSLAEPVLSIAATPEERLYMSMPSGVFRAHFIPSTTVGRAKIGVDRGQNWIKTTLEQTNIRSLAVFGSRIFAGAMSGGIFRSEAEGKAWTNMGSGNITSLATFEKEIFASASDGRVLRSTDSGNSWVEIGRINAGPGGGSTINNYISTLSVVGKTVYVGVPGNGVLRHGFVSSVRDWLVAAVPNTGQIQAAASTDWIKKYTGVSEAEFATVANGPKSGDKLTGQKDFDWRVATSTGILELDVIIQPEVDNDYITAYIFGYITSPEDRDTAMLVGSDDGIVVWVNGKEVHRNPMLRAMTIIDQDRFNIHLKKGKNAIMMKIIEREGGWRGIARFEKSKGWLFSTDKNQSGKELPADANLAWIPINVGLTNLYVTSLVTVGSTLYAGTEGNGVFRYDEKTNRWTEVKAGLTNSYVTALVVSGTSLCAGTRDGVYRLDSGSNVWKPVNAGLTDRNITALAASGKKLYAGTWGGKVFRSDDGGNSWREVGSPGAIALN